MDKVIDSVSNDIVFLNQITGMSIDELKSQIISSLKEEDNIEFKKEDLDELDKQIENKLKEVTK